MSENDQYTAWFFGATHRGMAMWYVGWTTFSLALYVILKSANDPEPFMGAIFMWVLTCMPFPTILLLMIFVTVVASVFSKIFEWLGWPSSDH